MLFSYVMHVALPLPIKILGGIQHRYFYFVSSLKNQFNKIYFIIIWTLKNPGNVKFIIFSRAVIVQFAMHDKTTVKLYRKLFFLKQLLGTPLRQIKSMCFT